MSRRFWNKTDVGISFPLSRQTIEFDRGNETLTVAASGSLRVTQTEKDDGPLQGDTGKEWSETQAKKPWNYAL